jgi:predicted nucleotidyltransferase
MNILLKSLVGSRLHGLHSETSDYDYKAVVISPLRDIISPFKTQKGKDSVTETEDNCYYEFQHFAKLMAQCNPTVLEVLWANHFETLHPLGKELVEGRQKLLHKEKIFYAHRGYASDQRKKMSLDEPNEYRTAKAIVSYIRIMHQGANLLRTGDFNPVIPSTSATHTLLMDIKYNFKPEVHVSWAEAYINVLEEDLQKAYDECKIDFKPDIPWIEDLLERAYLELGKP